MAVDFDDIFFNDENENLKLPDELLEVMTDKLPKGFKYVQMPGSKNLILQPTTEEGTVGGLKIDFNDPTFEDFTPQNINEALEYLYRTQKSIELEPKDSEFIILNDKRISTKLLINDPMSETDSKITKIQLTPQKFPEIEKVTLGNEFVSNEFKIKRIPHANMNEVLFETDTDKGFQLILVWDEKKESLSVNFQIQFENIQTVSDMETALNLYKACLTGNLKMNGKSMGESIIENSALDIEAINSNIELWHKISEIEDKLNIPFIPSNGLEPSDIILINKLYISLIEDKYFKEYVNIKSFTLKNIDLTKDEKFMKAELNQDNISINIFNPVRISLLGAEFNLQMASHLFDFKVKDVKIENTTNQASIIINQEESKNAYQCVKFFTKDNLNNESINQKTFEDIQNATLISNTNLFQ